MEENVHLYINIDISLNQQFQYFRINHWLSTVTFLSVFAFYFIFDDIYKKIIIILLSLPTKSQRGAVVKWLEQLGYGAESRRIA